MNHVHVSSNVTILYSQPLISFQSLGYHLEYIGMGKYMDVQETPTNIDGLVQDCSISVANTLMPTDRQFVMRFNYIIDDCV